MRTPNTPSYYLAKIILECQSPLSLKADESDPTIDSTLIRDAIGNPMIPGTSIAGVLSHLACDELDETEHKQRFGFADDISSQISAVQVGFAVVLNQKGQPQKGTVTELVQQTDDLIAYLQSPTPILRDQVKLNEYATAETGAKFDRTAVPKGTRFQFEMGLALDQKSDETWTQLLNLLSHPKFRLGGLTHRGFGQVQVVSCDTTYFDLKTPEGREAWQAYRREGWHALKTEKHQPSTSAFCTLKLKAEDFWHIGGGSEALGHYDKTPDALPYTEDTICIDKSEVIQPKQVVVPATSVKGALRHRTLFHLRRIEQDFEGKIQNMDARLTQIFGCEAGANVESDTQEQAVAQGVGGVIINDLYLSHKPKTKVMMHNKIDRFTGGVIEHALFSEELLFEDELPLAFYFDATRLKGLDGTGVEAFKCSIRDLAEGRLSLGAGSSKGHGYFQAAPQTLEDTLTAFEAATKEETV